MQRMHNFHPQIKIRIFSLLLGGRGRRALPDQTLPPSRLWLFNLSSTLSQRFHTKHYVFQAYTQRSYTEWSRKNFFLMHRHFITALHGMQTRY